MFMITEKECDKNLHEEVNVSNIYYSKKRKEKNYESKLRGLATQIMIQVHTCLLQSYKDNYEDQVATEKCLLGVKRV